MFNKLRKSEGNLLLFWVGLIAFLYALMAMIFLREVVIPAFLPSYGGHIQADPLYYHQIATEQANLISIKGVRGFSMHPNGQGVAGIASLFYVGWANPYLIVFMNAVMHAISVVVMILILKRFFATGVAIAASLPLLISPYMMLWYSQINKDSFTLVGVLLVYYGVTGLVELSTYGSIKKSFARVGIVLSGVFCIWVARPYVNYMTIPFVLILGFFSVVFSFKRVGMPRNRLCYDALVFLVALCGIAIALGLFSTGAESDKTLKSFYAYTSPQKDRGSAVGEGVENPIWKRCLEKVDRQVWEPEFFFQTTSTVVLGRWLGKGV